VCVKFATLLQVPPLLLNVKPEHHILDSMYKTIHRNALIICNYITFMLHNMDFDLMISLQCVLLQVLKHFSCLRLYMGVTSPDNSLRGWYAIISVVTTVKFGWNLKRS
jgi:hypothetical protein